MSFLDLDFRVTHSLENTWEESTSESIPHGFPANSVREFFQNSTQDTELLPLDSKRVCVDPSLTESIIASLPRLPVGLLEKEEDNTIDPSWEEEEIRLSANNEFNLTAVLEKKDTDINDEAWFKRLDLEYRRQEAHLSKKQKKEWKNKLWQLVPDPTKRGILSKQVRREFLTKANQHLLASQEVEKAFAIQYEAYWRCKNSLSPEMERIEKTRLATLLPHAGQRQRVIDRVLRGPQGIDPERKQKHAQQRFASIDRKSGGPKKPRVVLEGVSLEYYEKLKAARVHEDETQRCQLEIEAEQLPLAPELKYQIGLRVTQDLPPSESREKRLESRKERQQLYRSPAYQQLKQSIEDFRRAKGPSQERQKVVDSYAAVVVEILRIEDENTRSQRLDNLRKRVIDILLPETISSIEQQVLEQLYPQPVLPLNEVPLLQG